MTRKHFILVANVLRNQRNKLVFNGRSRGEFDSLVRAMAVMFRSENTRFDYNRFYNWIYIDEYEQDQF